MKKWKIASPTRKLLLRNWLLHSLNALVWPSTTYTMTHISMFDVVHKDMKLDDDSKYPFYGVTSDKPIESCNPYKGVI